MQHATEGVTNWKSLPTGELSNADSWKFQPKRLKQGQAMDISPKLPGESAS